MLDVMLDLETMGNGPDAAIVSIGAVKFDLTGIKSEFYRRIDLASSVASGGIIDASTVRWWLRQCEETRSEILGVGMDIREVLNAFWYWYDLPEPGENVWGNGADFDNVILRRAYDRAGIKAPWDHRQNRCYRTVRNLRRDIEMVRVGTHHNALDDAKSQALHLIEILKGIG